MRDETAAWTFKAPKKPILPSSCRKSSQSASGLPNQTNPPPSSGEEQKRVLGISPGKAAEEDEGETGEVGANPAAAKGFGMDGAAVEAVLSGKGEQRKSSKTFPWCAAFLFSPAHF